jgi:hypothetical protein
LLSPSSGSGVLDHRSTSDESTVTTKPGIEPRKNTTSAEMQPPQAWTVEGPTPIHYTRDCDVIRASPPNAVIYIEVEDVDKARGYLAWKDDTHVSITVHKPHDRSLLGEAGEVFAALYWSRVRGAERAMTSVVTSDEST